MKVIVKNKVYVVVEAHSDHVEVATGGGKTKMIRYDEPTLIVDPTDDDLRLSRDELIGRDVCAHANYHTIDIPNRVHECGTCKAHFTDTRRPMRYFRTHKDMIER